MKNFHVRVIAYSKYPIEKRFTIEKSGWRTATGAVIDQFLQYSDVRRIKRNITDITVSLSKNVITIK